MTKLAMMISLLILINNCGMRNIDGSQVLEDEAATVSGYIAIPEESQGTGALEVSKIQFKFHFTSENEVNLQIIPLDQASQVYAKASGHYTVKYYDMPSVVITLSGRKTHAIKGFVKSNTLQDSFDPGQMVYLYISEDKKSVINLTFANKGGKAVENLITSQGLQDINALEGSFTSLLNDQVDLNYTLISGVDSATGKANGFLHMHGVFKRKEGNSYVDDVIHKFDIKSQTTQSNRTIIKAAKAETNPNIYQFVVEQNNVRSISFVNEHDEVLKNAKNVSEKQIPITPIDYRENSSAPDGLIEVDEDGNPKKQP